MKTKLFILTIGLLILSLNGCVEINEEFANIRDAVIGSFGDEYKSEVQFSVGSVGVTVSSWIIDTSTEDDLPSKILEDVSAVQIGVYKKLKGQNSHNISKLKDIENKMQESGWKSIVRSSTENELTAVYIRKNYEEILDRLFIINYDGDELVLVDVEEDMKEAIATVIREKRLNVDI